MLGFTGALKVYVALEPADMRKSFNGLFALTRNTLGEDPRGGALFLFTNRSRNRLKILYWDGSGLWVMAKRLEKGSFAWPKGAPGEVKRQLNPETLVLLLNGVEVESARFRPWYSR
ncbi:MULTISPECIES: IS66 family insertion sequence element accessory protein TnpB [Oscillatoriales]|uniref:IS66 family insertion sequence element accessory protein TnpB n=1 Tax=Limnospira TaxID=2596745 RepID=UPI001682E4F6|nr:MULTISPECIES: IS66 family insertion sequence element accessory protein TnpB [Oscillatoriales]MBD2713209.1 IS66 family insertion sequence element accessory protein TnpB [Arthrospira platensis FACHB-835]MDT9298119.1 IS66 family insertion sequence element accessory protein TnpB [Arthrospira platensis PCC 7345]MDT9313496.1 IS66 family insertion sequence element accessory protein TnpB [Limnospira sp. Paracas R14]MBD2575543.1 IS66 family insertion sequence element accessory protein TnpB [Arthrospi